MNRKYLVGLSSLLICSGLRATVIRVPEEVATINGAVAAAADGDTILIAPGLYEEPVLIEAKDLTIGSWFLTTGEVHYVDETVIDGIGAASALSIRDTTPDAVVVQGLTIMGGVDCIEARARIQVLDNHLTGCADGIDYEFDGGGICRGNLIDHQIDDALDLDHSIAVVVEGNTLRDNGGDGIEIRLHPYAGPVLETTISNNIIGGNGEDGIQFIDYDGESDRSFLIQRNLIAGNGAAGLGCVFGQSQETFEGASIAEPVVLAHNVFDANNHGVCGGDEMLVVNNIVTGSTVFAFKNVDGNSLVSYTALWENGDNFENVNVLTETLVLAAPLLLADYRPQGDSPCIDAGHPRSPDDPDWTVADLGVYSYDQSRLRPTGPVWQESPPASRP
ncbi:MAG: hypothetical protein CME06_04735 [Gemmatimonadetes bacterium]|nr:hypothetical protein [Gemmatimonadota bacterium]